MKRVDFWVIRVTIACVGGYLLFLILSNVELFSDSASAVAETSLPNNSLNADVKIPVDDRIGNTGSGVKPTPESGVAPVGEDPLNNLGTVESSQPPSLAEVKALSSFGRRVALVIANASYSNASTLLNPLSDAASVSKTLREAGFQEVVVKTDLTYQGMRTTLREFAKLADGADWAVVYYAGHGIEFGGSNFLIPVDAHLQADRDIDLEGIELSKVIAMVEGAKRLRLIILDACRDNPFANRMRRTLGSRAIGRGLARVEPEPGTLIAYAAKHGETALDGLATRNSPYAEALVKRIRQNPPLEVRRLFDYVRDDVLEATNKKQQPFSYGSLTAKEDFYFSKPR